MYRLNDYADVVRGHLTQPTNKSIVMPGQFGAPLRQAEYGARFTLPASIVSTSPISSSTVARHVL